MTKIRLTILWIVRILLLMYAALMLLGITVVGMLPALLTVFASGLIIVMVCLDMARKIKMIPLLVALTLGLSLLEVVAIINGLTMYQSLTVSHHTIRIGLSLILIGGYWLCNQKRKSSNFS